MVLSFGTGLDELTRREHIHYTNFGRIQRFQFTRITEGLLGEFLPLSAGFLVPAVYLGSANLRVSRLLRVHRINNLRLLNAAFSSIPTAPTIYLSDRWTFNKNTRGQKGAD